ncbi:type I-E CRISPR-associated protein Cse1/CasA [Candidimonas nitroreducens]|uniref:type I-E CRISPR-associated protein Cse1/CasA n=1 Tax=Candidimonas nitroreducens TaxID=683354 RepID=UPI001303090C|nr:type I-E CRISPR-associated protein Cse1/CasA [Candidimonas nitroreducens]
MDHFSLLEQRWIPVRLTSGEVVSLGLLDVFRRQSDIAALACSRPPTMVGVIRLLLAIVHRALSCSSGRWTVRDRFNWHRDGLPADAIVLYLEKWRSRFNLFDPDFPFMQVAVLSQAEETRDKVKPWTQIDLASASGNTPIVFDHACDLMPTTITPADAVNLLLEYQSFVPGGLVKVFRSSDKAGPLANTAAVIPVGPMLWQTLCLNLHAPAVDRAIDDLPCWERLALTTKDLAAAPTLATGPNDRYTHVSRSVLLLREPDGLVRWLRFGAGVALDEDVQAPDPMAAYRKGALGLVRLTFTGGRALWRDLPALLPAVGAEGGKAPSVLEYAATLRAEAPMGNPYQPVWVAGLASDQAKLLRWRLEQIILPEKLLLSEADVRDFLDFVQVADALYGALRSVAVRLIGNAMPKGEPRERQAVARQRFDVGQYAAGFFSTVERSLPRVLRLLQEGFVDEARTTWGNTLRQTGQHMWNVLQKNQGFTPNALREQARQAPYFFSAIRRQLRDFAPVSPGVDQQGRVHE